MNQSSGYICPVHAGVRRLGPGQCPKCGNDLMERQIDTFHAFTRRLIVLGTLVIFSVVVVSTAVVLLK